jgi:hypothetical protein
LLALIASLVELKFHGECEGVSRNSCSLIPSLEWILTHARQIKIQFYIFHLYGRTNKWVALMWAVDINN